MSCTRRQFTHTSALLASVALSAVLASGASAADRFKVAFLASSSQNGYNKAIYDGIQAKAKELGNVDVEIFDGEFNATKQYSQVEDLVASKKFNAMIIVPNDTVGIANAVTDAVAAGLKVGTALFPIGPKLDTLEPQIPGLVTTVAYNPAVGAKAGADGLVKFCEGKDPCNTVIMIGQKIYPFDNLRYNTYLETLKPHANIKIVATVEGNYDPDKSMTGMQDVLQAHKDIVAILSNADQHLVGAEIALKDAGLDSHKMWLSGGGASQIAISAIRDGRWSATVADYPVSMGYAALEQIDNALTGKPVKSAIDAATILPFPQLIDKSVLDAHPDFKGEWPG
jgi:ribose transport system substrate-binding protein